MKQRGADILSQHSNSSLSLSAGCLSTGGGDGGGGLVGGSQPINLPVRWPQLASQWETLRQAGSDGRRWDAGRRGKRQLITMYGNERSSERNSEGDRDKFLAALWKLDKQFQMMSVEIHIAINRKKIALLAPIVQKKMLLCCYAVVVSLVPKMVHPVIWCLRNISMTREGSELL